MHFCNTILWGINHWSYDQQDFFALELLWVPIGSGDPQWVEPNNWPNKLQLIISTTFPGTKLIAQLITKNLGICCACNLVLGCLLLSLS